MSTTITIPATARAAVLATFKEDLEIKQVKVFQPAELAPGECLVKVEYAGGYRSSLWSSSITDISRT